MKNTKLLDYVYITKLQLKWILGFTFIINDIFTDLLGFKAVKGQELIHVVFLSNIYKV